MLVVNVGTENSNDSQGTAKPSMKISMNNGNDQLSICLSVHPSVSLSICLSVHRQYHSQKISVRGDNLTEILHKP